MKAEKIIIADNQDLTAIGVRTLIDGIVSEEPHGSVSPSVHSVACKAELVEILRQGGYAVVIVDYPLFDFSTRENFIMLCECYPHATWLILSDELTGDFLRAVLYGTTNVGVAYKDMHRDTLLCALRQTLGGERYISQHATRQLLEYEHRTEPVENTLTETEREVLRLIALGKTTKEIAAERHSSIHTINAHRRNIFSKLGVNCAYSAMKYAFRAGIVEGDFVI